MIRGSDGIGTHIVEIFVEHGRTSGTEIVVYDSGFVPGFGFESVHQVSGQSVHEVSGESVDEVGGESVDEVGGESVDEESAENSSSEEDDDSYDSDRSDESDPEYTAAFQTPLEDVEVDMRLYKAIVDFDVVEAAADHISDDDGLNPCINTYESSDDERLSVLNSMLRKFKGKERNNDDECPFYVGQLIPLKETLNEMIKKTNLDMFLWLSEIPAARWSRSHFSGRAKSDKLLNSLCENLSTSIGRPKKSRKKALGEKKKLAASKKRKRKIEEVQEVFSAGGRLTRLGHEKSCGRCGG
ncbi:uncharacterized protein LOC143586280 [Bidens hawaiensis]|uniref:uncharacterized protein LOC143586280 n=1 Tax=Bidens hawaiensis TaxID=980011 RepID=UPI00404AC3DD